MEIIGEYVRTHLGNIHKIVMYDEENEKYITDTLKCFDEVAVFKHSKNLIDLIEVGDYVNGKNVIEVYSYKDWIDIGEEVLRQDEINSIVTKQQFSNIEYKVGE